MKTINLIIFTLLTLTILIMSCETCPPSEYLGTKELFPISKTFIPDLQKSNIVIYIDSIGNEMEFLVESRETTFENHWVGVYCTTSAYAAWGDEIDVETVTIKLKTQIPLNNRITNMEYKFKVTNAKVDSLIMSRDTNNIFYDVLEIDNIFTMSISERGNDIQDYETISAIADTTILGKNFTTVYPIKYNGATIFYVKEKGVVSLRDYNNTLWVLDRIE
jgi:hypothetical protein